MKIPSVTKNQMMELDRVAVEQFGYNMEQMMELSGQKMATLVKELSGSKKKVLVCCGTGSNGGAGLICARYLCQWDIFVKVFLTRQEGLKAMPAQVLNSLAECEVDISDKYNDSGCDVIVDSLIGYGAVGEIYDPVKSAIEQVNASGAIVYAMDAPSGLNVDSGVPSIETVHADYTMTLGAVKRGLIMSSAVDYVGKLYLADIGIPPQAYQAAGVGEYPFSSSKDGLELVN